MRDLDGAPANELPYHCVSGNQVVARNLFLLQTDDRFQQVLHAPVPNVRIQKARVSIKGRWLRQQTIRPNEKGPQRRQIKWKTAIDRVVGDAAERNDAEKLAR